MSSRFLLLSYFNTILDPPISVHVTIEEKYLKQADLNPMLLIGLEGCVGTILIIGVILTTVSSIDGDDCGKYENVLDGLKQLSQNYLLLGLFLGAFVAIVFYVSLGLFVCSSFISLLIVYPHSNMCTHTSTFSLSLFLSLSLHSHVMILYVTDNEASQQCPLHAR